MQTYLKPTDFATRANTRRIAALEELLALKRQWNSPTGGTITVAGALKRLGVLVDNYTLPEVLREQAHTLRQEIILHSRAPKQPKQRRNVRNLLTETV